MSQIFMVSEEDLTASKGRIDRFLSFKMMDVSRTRIQALMGEGMILLNGVTCSTRSHPVRMGDSVEISIPPAIDATPQPQEIPFAILYEDEDLLVLDKPVGLVVHPAPGHMDHTLVNALLAHCGASLSGIGGVKRPGIVHRLDKDTSGLMVVAKNDIAHHGLQAQFSDRTLSRTYYALVWGAVPKRKGVIVTQIGRHPRDRKKMAVLTKGGRDAETHYERVTAYEGITLVRCHLKTGRTHQIRVHMAHLGCPIVGDPVYGGTQKSIEKKCKVLPAELQQELQQLHRQALHAYQLTFVHPITEQPLQFTSDFPEDLQKIMEALKLGIQ